MEPFDPRTEPIRTTDPATTRLDRLRERGVTRTPVRPQRAVLAWALTAALLAFALGLIANPWFERSVRSRLPGFAPTLSPTVADLDALAARVAVLEIRPVAREPAAVAAAPGIAQGERLARLEAQEGGLDAAVAAAAARTDTVATNLATLTGRIDGGAAAAAAALASATASAQRAQAMLVLVAARRQFDAGARLGGLEPALRRAFGGAAAAPVEAVAALGAAPVTAAGLRTGLQRLRPELTGSTAAGTARDWWQQLRESLAGVVVRQGATSGTGPAARIDRADLALAGGNVTAAAAEVTALPPAVRQRAAAWLAAADRYQAGQRGLAQLETMMLEPLPAAPAMPAAPMPSG